NRIKAVEKKMRIYLAPESLILENKVFLPQLLLSFKGILPLYQDENDCTECQSAKSCLKPPCELFFKKPLYHFGYSLSADAPQNYPVYKKHCQSGNKTHRYKDYKADQHCL